MKRWLLNSGNKLYTSILTQLVLNSLLNQNNWLSSLQCLIEDHQDSQLLF